jgi:hypothetical protein
MSEQTESTQSVVVYFRFDGDDETPVLALGQQLTAALAQSQAGVYDGHELALLDSDDGYLFMCGPDADILFEAVQPVLEASNLTRGGKATLRYGPPELDDVDERILTLAG